MEEKDVFPIRASERDALRGLLEEAAKKVEIWWNPRSENVHEAKYAMLRRIDAALSAKGDAQ
jgi:hypothetical protein